MVQLPTQRTEVDRRWVSQKLLMLGQAGVGKSSFFACDPHALFLDCDHNLHHLQVYSIPIWSWDDLRETYVQLAEQAAKKEPFPYSTIVLDTLDKALAYCEEDVIQRARERFKKQEIYALSDVPEGAGWSNTTKAFLQLLDKLAGLPVAFAGVSHTQVKRVEEPLQKYDREAISLWGQVGTKTTYFVNHILHVQAYHQGDRLVRKVYTLPRKEMEAKSHGAVIPDGWEMQPNMMANWVAVRNLFEPKVNADGTPAMPTPAQQPGDQAAIAVQRTTA